jgi:hypothetical protein
MVLVLDVEGSRKSSPGRRWETMVRGREDGGLRGMRGDFMGL